MARDQRVRAGAEREIRVGCLNRRSVASEDHHIHPDGLPSMNPLKASESGSVC